MCLVVGVAGIETTTALESAESWASIVTMCATAVVVVVGGIAAILRFLVHPAGNNWEVTAESCRLRKTESGWIYVLTIAVENHSAMGHQIQGWWQRIRFPNEVASGFDPDAPLELYGDAKVEAHYGFESRISDNYPVAPGEAFKDSPTRTLGTPKKRPQRSHR